MFKGGCRYPHVRFLPLANLLCFTRPFIVSAEVFFNIVLTLMQLTVADPFYMNNKAKKKILKKCKDEPKSSEI